MLELQNDRLVFSFPDVHPDAKATIDFHRTLRIPDDGKKYPLPPSRGRFPLKMVDDFPDRVPHKWKAHGGIMLPMYQSEALWLQFSVSHVRRRGAYPFAMKIAAGKVSAITGDEWEKGIKAKDYAVLPNQPWLDGYVVEEGLVKQFIAAPLGGGFTAEEQITGKAKHGGIQIEIFPMKREVFERRFPLQPELNNILRTSGMGGFYPAAAGVMPGVYSNNISSMDSFDLHRESLSEEEPTACAAVSADMGLGAGGQMEQQVFEDPYDITDWDTENGSRCFVHLANSLMWKAITKHEPPYPPSTAADYTRAGMPWFDYYTDDWKSLAGSGKLKGLKTMLEIGLQKGMPVLPENESVDFKSDQVVTYGKKRPDQVRAGEW